MVEIETWIFVLMIVGLIIGGLTIDFQLTKIKKLKKEIRHRESCSHPG